MLSSLSEQRKGELFVLLSALIWSLFPALTVFIVSTVPPILTAGLSMLISCILFSVVLTVRREWKGVREGKAMKDILIGTCINGIVFHGLVFYALSRTTAGNAIIVFEMEVLFAFLILSLVIKHEPFSFNHFIGAMFMVVGAFIILNPQASGVWNTGDTLILLATAIAPIGNLFQQKARRQVSAEHLLLVRSFLAGLFLVSLSFLVEEIPSTQAMFGMMPIIFLNGILVFGISKILWVESFIRIPITKANSIAAIAPFFGLIFAYFILSEVPTSSQLISIVPITLGVLMLMRRR